MPDERWLDGHTGDEMRPRSGFGDELADRLTGAWRGEVEATVGPPRSDPRPSRVGIVITLVACVLVLAFVALAITRDSRHHDVGVPTSIAGGSSTTLAPTTLAPTTLAPTTLAPTTLAGPTETVPPTDSPTTVGSQRPIAVPADADQRAVFDYLTALSQQRWADAATALRGSVEDTDRADLRPIFAQLPDVAGASRAWCTSGGACQQPTGLDTPQPGWVSVGYVIRGRKLMQWFQVSTFESKTTVRGLPIKVPTDVDVNRIVQCEVAKPVSVVPADVNGDGWFEQIVIDAASTVHVCDTTLVIAPLTVSSPFGSAVSAYPIDVRGDGYEQLFIGSTFADGFEGGLYAYVSSRGGYIIGKTVVVSPVMGRTVGCIDVSGDGKRDFVAISFSFVGGTNADNSTAVKYSATYAEAPVQSPGTEVIGNPGLPVHSTAAVRLMGGYCGDRLIMTG
jgi:hypothetical protein